MSKFKRDEAQPSLSPDAKRDLAWRQNGRDMVSAEVEQMLRARGSEGLPECIPRTVRQGAAWLIDVLIDPPADDETIRRTPAFSGSTWATPYRDRAVYLARKFLSLPPRDQAAVCAYAQNGLRWRGDDVNFLALVAAERVRGDGLDRAKRAIHRATEGLASRGNG